MGDTRRLRSDDVVPLVDPAQEDAAEVDRPDPVVDLLEPDRVLLEGVGDEHEPFLEPDRPGVGDPLDDEGAGILDRGQDSGIRAGGGPEESGRRAAAQGLVGSLAIVEATEGGEGPLLERQRGAGGGRIASPLSVLDLRSWAPFCCGCAGRIRWC